MQYRFDRFASSPRKANRSNSDKVKRNTAAQ